MQQRRPARPYVRPVDASPHTPSGRPHDRINSIFENLELHWRLGLTPRDDKTWSPSHSRAREPSGQYQCSQKLKLLYFKGADHLDKALKEFNANAHQKAPKDRLPYLRRLLDDGLKRANTKAEASASRTPLQRRLEQVASSSASLPRSGATSIFNPPHLTTEHSTEARAVNEGVPYYSAMELPLDDTFVATQPNTPTAADDEEPGEAPPSPSLQASVRRQSSHSQRGSRRGKRLSDGSTESEPSPKQPRTSSERNRASEASFAVPDSPRGRQTGSMSSSSRRQSTATSMTATTSFTSTRTDSMFSQNGDRTRTANTSFATTIPSQPQKAQEEFHSSGTYGTLGSDDWNTAFDDVGEGPSGAAAAAEEEESRFRPNIPLDELIRMSTVDLSQGPIRPGGDMEHHQVKALPRGGLFVPEISERLLAKDFKYRWEFLRVALDAGIDDPDQLLPRGYNEEWGEYSCLWDYFRHHDALSDVFDNLRRGSEKAWAAAEVKVENNTLTAFENITLKATLSFTGTREGPIFKTRLHPLQLEAASCRFQRAFGGDRFLYLETPVFRGDQVPAHLKGQIPAIKERFEEWLGRTCGTFLGRVWQPIHVEPIKATKKTMFRQQEQLRGYRVILFATHGRDIDPTKKRKIRSGTRYRMSVYDLVNWFMPLDLNCDQPYLKVFSRISLGLTTTLSTLTFTPEQVRYVADIKANNEHEDRQFDDNSLDWPRDEKTNRVMNDGCSRISVGAARLIWEGVEGPIPSTFQGRIGGAKGMWMLSASPDTADPYNSSIWIEVSDSQRKFKPHEDDIESDFDPCRFTFDLHSTTGTAMPSSVYLSFFPILQDRGVPASSLKNLFEGHIDKEREKLLEAIKNPVHLRKWVNEQNSLAEERNREDDEMTWQGGMPLQLQEKVALLLESGFDTSCAYLTDVTQRLVAKSLRLMRQDVRVPLPRCTYIKGVADPYGILAPGEVHIQFTKSFVDEVSRECLNFLDNRNVLVARNPALRRSDIQKVRATFKIELAHLKDVAVFPTRGSFPLAGKLQGGDYDGDTFWVTWEPDLVQPFKNAPPPLEDPVPEKYCVKVDRRKLGEMLDERRSVGKFLRESFKFRCKPNLLGQATKLHEKVWYHEKSLTSAKAEALVDLHDLLVDYSKNGYEFDDDDFKKFKATFKIPTKIEKPKYEEARQADREEKKLSTKRALARSNSARKHGAYNKDNILDQLYFETLQPHTFETLQILEDHFRATSTTDDPTLEAPFLAEQEEAKDDPVIAEELAALTTELSQIWDDWIGELHRKKSASFSGGLGVSFGGGGGNGGAGGADVDDAMNDPDRYNAAVDRCFPRFHEWTPQFAEQSPVIRRWTKPDPPGALSHWEMLKASALFHIHAKKLRKKKRMGEDGSSAFVFHMAGAELCWIKAHSCGARPMTLRMWQNMKPKKIKPAGLRDGAGRRGGGAAERKKGRDGERRFGTGRMVDDGDGRDGDETEYASAAEEIGEEDDE